MIYFIKRILGIGGTNAWKICGIYPNSTLSVFLEVLNQVGVLAFLYLISENWLLFSNKDLLKLHQEVKEDMFSLLHNINICLDLKRFGLQLWQESKNREIVLIIILDDALVISHIFT
jgi:hypothetical protein